VAGAQGALQTAQNNLAAATLTAPTGGTIASLNGSVGQWISGGPVGTSSSTTSSSSSSSAFITLTDLGSPQVSASVSEADIGKVQPGQKVNFTVTAYPNRTFSGTVVAIEPAGTTTSNVVTYVVRTSVDPTDVHLLPSMTATIAIITQSAENVVLVPNAAISNGRVGVLRSNGNVTQVPVVTGITDGVNTQIVSGLQPGDQVVTGVSYGGGSSRPGSSSAAGGSSIFGIGAPGGGGGGTRPPGGSGAQPSGGQRGG
jgi:RND family efflux transporter MFP subunit